MTRTLKVSVREELTERKTILVDLPDHIDITDEDALNEFLEAVWTGDNEVGYREVPHTNEVAINERSFFDPEVL